MTRISPFGCMTPRPILPPQIVGRSVDLGSGSIVNFINRRTRRVFNSFRAKCLDKKKVSNIEKDQGSHFFMYLPSHIETPPPNGMVWLVTDLPFFMNFFCIMYLVGMYSSGRSWTSGSKCTALVEHTITSPSLNVNPPNSVGSMTPLMDMEEVVKRKVSWIAESSNGRFAWLTKSMTFR